MLNPFVRRRFLFIFNLIDDEHLLEWKKKKLITPAVLIIT